MNRFLAPMLALSGMAIAGCEAPEEPMTQPASPIYSGAAASPFRYPVALWDAQVEGETMLMVHVTPEGGVDSIRIETSSGEPAMDSAAIDGARELRFQPARRGPETVDVWVRLPVRFSLDGAPPRPVAPPPDTADSAAAAQP